MIGSGVYGKVYRSTHAKNNNLYAIKIIPIKTFKDIPKL
jgi:serine/threonine protein kinase